MAEENKLILNNPGLVEIFSRKAKSKDEIISKVEMLVHRRVSAKTKFLLDKAFELAAGIYILDERDPLKTRYYKKPPNLEAIIYLIDRVLGKPVAKSETFDKQAKKGVAELQNIIQVLAGGQVNITNNGNGNKKPVQPVIDVRAGENPLQE